MSRENREQRTTETIPDSHEIDETYVALSRLCTREQQLYLTVLLERLTHKTNLKYDRIDPGVRSEYGALPTDVLIKKIRGKGTDRRERALVAFLQAAQETNPAPSAQSSRRLNLETDSLIVQAETQSQEIRQKVLTNIEASIKSHNLPFVLSENVKNFRPQIFIQADGHNLGLVTMTSLNKDRGEVDVIGFDSFNVDGKVVPGFFVRNTDDKLSRLVEPWLLGLREQYNKYKLSGLWQESDNDGLVGVEASSAT